MKKLKNNLLKMIIFQDIENKYIYIYMNKYNKIFVIGLNKTGTLTIHSLFKANGFKSVHWGVVDSNPKYKSNGIEESVLYNLKNNNNLLDKELDEKYQVFSDIQNLSLNFELLDKQYPNSLFIYNYRNVNNWIVSRLNHKCGNYLNYWRKNKKKLNLSDTEVIEEWINLHRTHHEKVMSYFKNNKNFIYYNIEEESIQEFINKLPFELNNIIEKKHITGTKYYKLENNEIIKISHTKKTNNKKIFTFKKMIIIPIGLRCNVAEYLKKNNLRKESHLFDWDFTLNLNVINKIIEDDNLISNYFDIDDITNEKVDKNFGAGKGVKNLLLSNNKFKGLIFRHFDIREEIQKNIYIRRIERLLYYLNNDEKIIFVRVLNNGESNKKLNKVDIFTFDNINDCHIDELNLSIEKFFNILKNKYNRKNDKLYLINNNIIFNQKIIKQKNVLIY